MPGKKEQKQDRDDSRGERGDITRTRASTPPPLERSPARGGLPGLVTKDSQNQDTSGTRRSLLSDLVRAVFVFSVGFGCVFFVRETRPPTLEHTQSQEVSIIVHPPKGHSGYTVATKILSSISSVTVWLSDSRVSSQVIQPHRAAARVLLTSGNRSCSRTSAMTIDL